MIASLHSTGPTAPLVAVLRQMEGLLTALTDEQYRAKPAGFSSSIGGHVRHCLDHVASLLAALDTGRLDYDVRRRGTAVEHCRRAALDALAHLEQALVALAPGAEDRPLSLTCLLSPGWPPFAFGTTAGRELAFVLSHTIHHNALVAVMARALDVGVPERFGYAPATIAHLSGVAR